MFQGLSFRWFGAVLYNLVRRFGIQDHLIHLFEYCNLCKVYHELYWCDDHDRQEHFSEEVFCTQRLHNVLLVPPTVPHKPHRASRSGTFDHSPSFCRGDLCATFCNSQDVSQRISVDTLAPFVFSFRGLCKALLKPFSRNGTPAEQETIFGTPVRVCSIATLSDPVVRVREHEAKIEIRQLLLNPDMLLAIFYCQSTFGLNVNAIWQNEVRSV